MRIQTTNQTTEPQFVTQPSKLFAASNQAQTTLVSATSPDKATSAFAKAWTYCKTTFFRFFEWVKGLFGFCSVESSKIDIIEQMIYDPKGKAKEFAANFNEHCNALVQAAYDDPKGIKELMSENKKAFKEFCKHLAKELDKKDLSRDIGEIKAVILQAIDGIQGPLDLTPLNGHLEHFKSCIASIGTILLNFFKEVKLKLETSRERKEEAKKGLDALNALFGSYFPALANEMIRNPAAFTHFLEEFLKKSKSDQAGIINLLQDDRYFKGQTTAADVANLKVCLASDCLILDQQITSAHYAPNLFGLKTPVNYKMLLLQALTPEQFESFIPLFVKDPKRCDIYNSIFKEIKSVEEPITVQRLNAALECLNDLYTAFDSPIGA